MRTFTKETVLGALALAVCLAGGAESPGAGISYPATRAEKVTDDYFGTAISDPYRWLENGESPEVAAWTEAQNAVTRRYLDAVPARPAIAKRLKALWNYEKMDTPVEAGGLLFYTKNDGLQNQSPLYVQEGPEGASRVLIDPNTLSADGTVAMDWWYVSEKGKYVAYGTSPNGTEQSVLRIRETATGRDLSDVIDGCRFSSVAWLPDETGFYYTRFPKPGTVPENERNYNRKVLFHRLGDDPEADTLVLACPAKKEIGFGVALSNDANHLLISAYEGSDRSTEIWVKDLRSGALVQITRGFHDQYEGEIYNGVFYCLTTEGAPNGRVFAVDLVDPRREKWTEIIPEGKDSLDSIAIYGGRLFVESLHNATCRVDIRGLDGKDLGSVPLPPMVSVSGTSGRWDSRRVFLTVSGFTLPKTVLRYDVGEGSLATFFAPRVPFRTDDFATEQVWVTSRDGTKVSMFVAHKKDLRRDGTAPCYLTGYGGFTISETPFFSPVVLWWLEQGGVFALPNLRGGGEYGEAWHRAGMREKKQNVFDDFYAAAEFLVANGYTSKERLAAEGGSNGGLLTGAALTQRPDLFGAVVIEVPLLDMLRYHRFSIARYWIPEYGSSEDPEQFKYLRAYSPYHNVRGDVTYPPTLLMTGASDSRVDPLHARKMAALLQAEGKGGPFLLRVETKAGHGQGKPTAKRIEEAADRFAFLVRTLGMKVR
ncbi:MAG: prolyl oligopeptidase family serine peptidase [Acidobacteriota bacterium]